MHTYDTAIQGTLRMSCTVSAYHMDIAAGGPLTLASLQHSGK